MPANPDCILTVSLLLILIVLVPFVPVLFSCALPSSERHIAVSRN